MGNTCAKKTGDIAEIKGIGKRESRHTSIAESKKEASVLDYIPSELLQWNKLQTMSCTHSNSSPCEESSTVMTASAQRIGTSAAKPDECFIKSVVMEFLLFLFFHQNDPDSQRDTSSEAEEDVSEQQPSAATVVRTMLKDNLLEKQYREVQAAQW